MHHIYQTEGIILGGADFGEANKYLFIFTKDFGLIRVAAQGLRRLKSKLQSGLQDFSWADLSLVRGKSIWRITNASYKQNFYNSFSSDKEKLIAVIHILILLKKLLPDEGRNETLYAIIMGALSFLKKERLLAEEIGSFEKIVLIRTLHNLGYFNERKKISNRARYEIFLKSPYWKKDLLTEMTEIKTDAVRDINEALNATHLFFTAS